jgi:acyl-CoA oxidase
MFGIRHSLICLEGPKVMGGGASTDNGFARFNHVRIPKENMLSGFAQVTDDGQYLNPPHKKIGYGGVSISPTNHTCVSFMTYNCRCYTFVRCIYNLIRSSLLILTSFSPGWRFSRLGYCSRSASVFRHSLISQSDQSPSSAATIAIRYATVRRQGDVGPDGMEKQVITYPSVHGRLLPILARAYVFIQLGRRLVRYRTSYSIPLQTLHRCMHSGK